MLLMHVINFEQGTYGARAFSVGISGSAGIIAARVGRYRKLGPVTVMVNGYYGY